MRKDVKQWYVVYEFPNRKNKAYGGPYTPTKSKEIKQALETQIENNNYESNNIPTDAEGVFLSSGKETVLIDGEKKRVWK